MKKILFALCVTLSMYHLPTFAADAHNLKEKKEKALKNLNNLEQELEGIKNSYLVKKYPLYQKVLAMYQDKGYENLAEFQRIEQLFKEGDLSNNRLSALSERQRQITLDYWRAKYPIADSCLVAHWDDTGYKDLPEYKILYKERSKARNWDKLLQIQEGYLNNKYPFREEIVHIENDREYEKLPEYQSMANEVKEARTTYFNLGGI